MAVALEQRPDGEVRIETGRGFIQKIEHEDGQRNAHVVFRATHTNLRHPPAAWVDTSGPLWPLAQEAAATGDELEYRIVVHRKANVDKDPAIADLANTDKVRDLDGLDRVGNSPNGETVGGTVVYPEQTHDAPRRAQRTPAPVFTQKDGGVVTPEKAAENGASQHRSARVQEPRPFELRTGDSGELSPGSYAFGAVLGCVHLSRRLLADHARADAGDDSPQTVPLAAVKALARCLLEAADRAQARLRADHRVDRMSKSHDRARSAVAAAVIDHPVPWGADAEVRAAWIERLAEAAGELLAVAWSLHVEHEDSGS